MDTRKIVVLVEDVEASRTALRWALHNLCRYGDVITLLHVFSSTTKSSSRNKNKMRLLRLEGFKLALSFKDICNSNFFNTNVEIIVAEGDQGGGGGAKILSMVRDIGASALVLGLHDNSFLYRLAMDLEDVASSFNCRMLAIRQPPAIPQLTNTSRPTPSHTTTTSLDFSQVDLSGLQLPELTPPKVQYKVCPDPYAIIYRWRKKPKRRRRSSCEPNQPIL